MKKQTILIILMLLCSKIIFSQNNQLEVKPDKQNIIANKIEGLWKFDRGLNSFLISGKQQIKVIRFERDYSKLEKIPENFARKLENLQIYDAGLMTINKEITFPYLLTILHGNPHIIFFEISDDKFDSESFNVMFAQAEKTKNDLLFIGGDFASEPFMAFRRKKEKNKKKVHK